MSAVVGALAGLGVGAGLAVAASRTPWARRPTLVDRIGPHLADADASRRLLVETQTRTPFPTLERLFAPAIADGVRVLERTLGGAASVRRRLDRLGTGQTLDGFRVEQLAWGALGAAAGIGWGLLLLASGRAMPLLALAVFAALGALAGVLARDQRLTAQARRREERMLAEFPTVAEMLALCVAAGEGPVAALDRVAALSTGETSRELARTVADGRADGSVVRALERLAARTGVAPVARFADAMAVALERGTPLADVLRAQAVDAREAGRRALIEAAARKEIAMMVPVVFLVMPVSVIFLLFPGFVGLSLDAP